MTADIPARIGADLDLDAMAYRFGRCARSAMSAPTVRTAGADGLQLILRLKEALARAQKAEARVSELTADCDACVSCEGDTLSPDGFCARCKMADDAEENDRLRAELAEAKRDKDYLYGRTLDLGDERDRLSAQVAAVRDWAMANEIAAPPLDWAGLGRALDGTGPDEPRRPVVPPPNPMLAVRPCCGDSHCGDGCDPSAVETFSQPTEGSKQQ